MNFPEEMGTRPDSSFWEIVPGDGLLTGFADADFPTEWRGIGWEELDSITLPDGKVHFYFQLEGKVEVDLTFMGKPATFPLYAGMHFVHAGACTLRRIEKGPGLAISSPGLSGEGRQYEGLFQFGGSLTDEGDLRYIDGGSTSLLFGPMKVGDPCLNLLHFPAGHHQKIHQHPSFRGSFVAKGRGRCIVPNPDKPDDYLQIQIGAGDIFVVPTDGWHAIHTDADSPMTIITYHPTTTLGWTDESHPMMDSTLNARQIDLVH